jgi:hypothetical protein
LARADLAGRVLRRALATRSRWASRYFVSLGSANPDVIFIAGTGRSGTTWLAELLGRTSKRRLLFEPFRKDRVPLWQHAEQRQYVRPDDTCDDMLGAARRIMRGDLRNDWTDYYNEHFITRGLIVKDIRANLMLRWLYENAGPFPIVFLIRHPAAVAASWLREEWTLSIEDVLLSQEQLVDDYLRSVQQEMQSPLGPLDQIAYLWSVETVVPLTQFSARQMLVVFYESLVADPAKQLQRICSYVGETLRQEALLNLERASATTTPGVRYESQLARLDSWRVRLTTDEVARVARIAGRFGLDGLYGDDGLPLVEPDSVLERFPVTRRTVEMPGNDPDLV